MKIETTVNINFSEDDMKQMILDKVKEHDDRIVVKSIEFTQKRSPTRMSVDVEAFIGKGVADNSAVLTKVATEVAEATTTETTETTETEETVVEEVEVTQKTKLFGDAK